MPVGVGVYRVRKGGGGLLHLNALEIKYAIFVYIDVV